MTMTDAEVQALLRTTGPYATQAGLADVEPILNRDGITLQRNSAGEIRGRMYWTNGRVVDVVEGSWGTPWVWIERVPGTTPPPTEPTDPPAPPTPTCQFSATDLTPILARLTQLEQEHATLLAEIRNGGWPVRVSNGWLTLSGIVGPKAVR